MKIGKKFFDIGSRTFIVGVINVTPDSFSDGNRYNDPAVAVAHAQKLIADGADIIEIGGESTRPGYTPVGEKEELQRVLPVVQELAKKTDIPISVDTRKAAIAQAVLTAGASMINDVDCFKTDPDLALVCAEHNAVCCTMHNRNNTNYTDLLTDIMTDLEDSVTILQNAGIGAKNIIIDPGIGFAKNADQSIEVLRNIALFKKMPYPLMVGASKKSYIGHRLGFSVENRSEATLATTVFCITQGVDFVRVHDVAQNKKAAMMADVFAR